MAKQGPDHPNTLEDRSNLAAAYQAAGQTAEAIPLLEQTLKLETSKLGPDHPATLTCRNNLAAVYVLAGRTRDAIALYEENFGLLVTKLGPDHPSTLRSRNGLARAYDTAGLFAKSETILHECLMIRERVQPDDWWTFHTRGQLGGSLLGQKKLVEAEPLILSGYEGMKAREARIPAPNKKFLTAAAERVVKLYEVWGKKDKAEQWRAKLAKPSAESKHGS
jgi:tetratricopeptide (TPR) repeat protein